VHAVRAPIRPVLDGKLDDAVWQLAPVLDGFVQASPNEGNAATERTEARILYDDRAIYLGVRCWDSHAAEIRPRLGRRDNLPESDWVALDLDTYHDRRSAYEFLVNTAGVQQDGIITEGQGGNNDWDGVWDARTSIDAEGWTVEMEIPFHTLRFPRTSPQTWGFHLTRYISRLKEIDHWNLIRFSDASQIGRYEELDGIAGARPGLSLQLIPYAVGTLRASRSTDSLAPSGSSTGQVGLDLKYGLTGTLTLDGTINPDFAQVEVDPEVVNLSAYEVFFPEKRPFFLEGLDIFQPVSFLVYTRRVGAPPHPPDPLHADGTIVALDPVARILGALKVTGNLLPGTAVGVLGAYVDETSAVERVGPGYLSPTYRVQASPATWFSAARVRQVISGQSAIGLTETTVLRGRNDRPDLWQDGHVVTMDFDLRGRGDYTLSGNAGLSWARSCSRDYSPSYHGHGTCEPTGAGVTVGKTGGELQVFEFLDYTGAELDLNDMGFFTHILGTQAVGQNLHMGYNRQRALGPFKRVFAHFVYDSYWDPNAGSAADPFPLTDHRVVLIGNARTRNDWTVGGNVNHAFSFSDDVETRQNPMVRLYARKGAENFHAFARSNESKALSVGVSASVNYDHRTASTTYNLSLDPTLLLAGRLQLDLHVGWNQWLDRPRWVEQGTASGLPIFGQLDLKQLELTARGTLAFSRDLTVQLYSQLLRSVQHYPRAFVLTDPHTFMPCDPGSLCPDAVAPGAYDADLTSLIVDAIVRWQFRPGSTMFLVYTHNHQVGGGSGRFDLLGGLSSLGASPADNVLALKLSYLWAL